MSFVSKNPRSLGGDAICLVKPSDEVIRGRKTRRLGLMMFATLSYFALTGLALAFMAPAPAPEPEPPAAPAPEPSPPERKRPDSNPAANPGEDRDRPSRKIRRSHSPTNAAPRGAITDQTYYGGKLGLAEGKKMSFIAGSPTRKPGSEER